jgi:hypothetical protein
MLELLALLVLSPLAVYFLTILLRVSCHFCGVDIPAIGRAFFTTFVCTLLSLVAWAVFQSVLVGFDPPQVSARTQFPALLLALATHMLITTILYTYLLDLRLGRAFSVWLVQALTFAGFALLLACCLGVPLMLLGQVP